MLRLTNAHDWPLHLLPTPEVANVPYLLPAIFVGVAPGRRGLLLVFLSVKLAALVPIVSELNICLKGNLGLDPLTVRCKLLDVNLLILLGSQVIVLSYRVPNLRKCL